MTEKQRIAQFKLHRKRRSEGKCWSCNRISEPNKALCTYHREMGIKYQQNLKDKVFEQYGGYICNCCKETNQWCLTLDHINGNGNKHRLSLFGKIGTAGNRFYHWIKKNGFPEGFQVLCFNCNWIKHLKKECTHNACV